MRAEALAGRDKGVRIVLRTMCQVALDSCAVLQLIYCLAMQELSPEEAQYALREKRLRNIISGRTPILLYLEFLYSHNHADLVLLKNAKAAIEARNRCCCLSSSCLRAQV